MEKSILIADCGSTSCEWRLISGGSVGDLPATSGFNPNYQPPDMLTEEIQKLLQKSDFRREVGQVYYYGTGCSSIFGQNQVRNVLRGFFKNADIEVTSDLWGSVRAFYNGEPVICGILGTGSNSARFDGKEMTHCAPSLGFILGDEGSGGKIGQLLLRAFYYREMPESLRKDFAKEYDLDLDNQLDSVYRSSKPAAHLAQYARFAGKHKDNPFIDKLVGETLNDFLRHFICGFDDYREVKVGIVGSVAHHFSEILKARAEAAGISNIDIEQRPIDRLAQHYLSQH